MGAREYEFSRMSEAALADETMRRAREVWDVNGRSWDAATAAFGAWAASSLGAFAIVAVTSWNPMLAFATAFPIGTAVSWVWIARWLQSLADVKDYTNEMKARTAELRRRQARRAALASMEAK